MPCISKESIDFLKNRNIKDTQMHKGGVTGLFFPCHSELDTGTKSCLITQPHLQFRLPMADLCLEQYSRSIQKYCGRFRARGIPVCLWRTDF